MMAIKMSKMTEFMTKVSLLDVKIIIKFNYFFLKTFITYKKVCYVYKTSNKYSNIVKVLYIYQIHTDITF